VILAAVSLEIKTLMYKNSAWAAVVKRPTRLVNLVEKEFLFRIGYYTFVSRHSWETWTKTIEEYKYNRNSGSLLFIPFIKNDSLRPSCCPFEVK
jgi:hypothetical protein